MSNNVNINGATDRTSIRGQKIYKDDRKSLNKKLLLESYFMRNILDLSAIMALGNLKRHISCIVVFRRRRIGYTAIRQNINR